MSVAAAGHVGRDGDRPRRAGLGDDVGFLLVVAGVQHLVRNILLFQQLGDVFGFFDGDRADQHRLLSFPAILDQLDDGVVFLRGRAIDLVVLIVADDGQVGGNLDDFQFVDLGEFPGFGHRRAGHAGKLRVHAEIVLIGDRGEGLVFLLDGHPLLGLERLVQAFGEAAAFHHPAGELVDDHDLAVVDHVVGIALEHGMGAERLIDVVNQRDIGVVVQIAVLQQPGLVKQLLDMLGALIGQGDGAHFLVFSVVFLDEVRDHLVHRRVHVR